MRISHLRLLFCLGILILLGCSCTSPAAQPSNTGLASPQARPPTATATPVLIISTPMKAEKTPIPTTTRPPALTEAPTLTPVEKGILNPFTNKLTLEETVHSGNHEYSYSCYAWWPCSCLAIAPSRISLSMIFSSSAVILGAGNYEVTYLWYAENTYSLSQESLTTQLSFFQDRIELYSTISEGACRLEQYSLLYD